MRWVIAFVALVFGLGALGCFAVAALAPGASSAAPATAGSLACSVRDTNCEATEVAVFRMSSLANAHAEVPGGTTYGKVVCCGGVVGLDNSCSGTYETVLTLSDTGNAHVASDASYATDACLSVGAGTVDCTYGDTCGGGSACLATISNSTNAHVADCDGYTTKVCCTATGGAVGGIAELPEVTDSSRPNYIGLAALAAAAVVALAAGAWYVRRRFTARR